MQKVGRRQAAALEDPALHQFIQPQLAGIHAAMLFQPEQAVYRIFQLVYDHLLCVGQRCVLRSAQYAIAFRILLCNQFARNMRPVLA